MATVLSVRPAGKGKVVITYAANHPQEEDIDRWLKYLSPGYVEYLLQNDGHDPHCSACRATDCENVGNGDDACQGFVFGEDW